MKDYIWLFSRNYNLDDYPYRKAWSTFAGTWEFPIDRWNILEGELGIPCHCLIREPSYNLEGLGGDWKERYFSILDSVADEIYTLADSGPNGRKTIALTYSGGVDSTVILCSLQKHPKYQDFLDSGHLYVSMTSGSIDEYPFGFFQKILPTIPFRPLDYSEMMNDANTIVVTGDFGDHIFQSSDTLSIVDYNFNLTNEWKSLIPYINRDTSGRYFDICYRAKSKAPFEIKSAGQLVWWLAQCFNQQEECVRPYLWSTTSDIDSLINGGKVYQFFYHREIVKFSYEYMSTNPNLPTYESGKRWSKEYVVNHLGDKSYLNKSKVYSQRNAFRIMYKTKLYIEDGTPGYSTDHNQI